MRSTTAHAHGCSSDTACDRAGITYRVLDYWCRLGVAQPLGPATPGSGGQRRWGRHEVRVLSALARLSDLGATTEVLRRVGPMLRGMPVEEWRGELLVAKSGAVEHLRHGTPVTFGEACWVVNLDLCAMRAA